MKKELALQSHADFTQLVHQAQDFANEITDFNVKRKGLRTDRSIAREHIKNNAEVRKLLGKRGIVPEQLPLAEDVKKLQRRVESEQKKLPKRVRALESDEGDS
jgi:DNA-damage-inducible protein D